MDQSDGEGGRKFNGIQAAVEMLGGLEPLERERLLAQVAQRDPRLAQEISQGIEEKFFGFEALVRLEAADLQKLLREVPRSSLALAMRAASDGIKRAIFANLSSRSAQELREEIESSGPRKLSDVKAAQVSIAELARRQLGK